MHRGALRCHARCNLKHSRMMGIFFNQVVDAGNHIYKVFSRAHGLWYGVRAGKRAAYNSGPLDFYYPILYVELYKIVKLE